MNGVIKGTLTWVVGSATACMVTTGCNSPRSQNASPKPAVTGGGAVVAGSRTESQGEIMTKSAEEKDAEWRAKLTQEQYHVTRQCGTERAFTGKYWNHHEDGVYRCICCSAELFPSDTKFDSGSGWPSFWNPTSDKNVTLKADNSYAMSRTEVTCSQCGAHLGHLFNDGPAPSNLRYCINSASLDFEKGAQAVAEVDTDPSPKK